MGHGHARPLSPRQNGKAGRVNRTLAREWQYARVWESEGARASALAPFVDRYNRDRPHSACGGLPPMSRIAGVNNVLAHNSYRLCSHSVIKLCISMASRLRGVPPPPY